LNKRGSILEKPAVFKVKQKTVSIIGLGNSFMGDDALGPYIIEYLRENYETMVKPVAEPLNINIKLMDASQDPILAGAVIAEGNPVILIDAAEMNLPPGEYRLLKIPDIRKNIDLRAVSTHGFNIVQVLDMADEFGYSEFVKILAVQLGSIHYGDAISKNVLINLNKIIKEILKEVREINEKENTYS